MKNAQQGFWGGIEFLKSYHNFEGGLTLRYYRTTILNYGPNPVVYVNRLSLAAILLDDDRMLAVKLGPF
jgi:hypothetical protein